MDLQQERAKIEARIKKLEEELSKQSFDLKVAKAQLRKLQLLDRESKRDSKLIFSTMDLMQEHFKADAELQRIKSLPINAKSTRKATVLSSLEKSYQPEGFDICNKTGTVIQSLEDGYHLLRFETAKGKTLDWYVHQSDLRETR